MGELAGEIQTAIKEATHPSERPLLTVAEREDEVKAMVQGVDVADATAGEESAF